MIVDCAVYEHGRRRDGQVPLEHAYDACRKKGNLVWIGLYEPSPDEFDSLKREFNLHELAVEDAIKAHQRPKIEIYGDMIFIVLKTARYVDPKEVVQLGEIQVFLGEGYVITVRHGEASELHSVREGLEQDPDRLDCGPGAILHAIADRVVDDYMPALTGLEIDVDEVEDQVFSPDRHDSGAVAERIYKLKREVLEFHRATAPLIEPMERLVKGHYELIHPDVRAYFRDVNDHLMRCRDQLEGLRELLTGVLEANLTQVSVRQNEDMRKISAWVAILAVPTMIAGIYGMNFRHMPELSWRFGYPAALTLMLLICIALHRSFKRWGWL